MQAEHYDAVKAAVSRVLRDRATVFWDDEPEAMNVFGLTARLSIVSDVGRNGAGGFEISRRLVANKVVEEVRQRRKATVQILLESTMPGAVPPGNALAVGLLRTRSTVDARRDGIEIIEATAIGDLSFEKASRVLQASAVSLVVFYTVLSDGLDEEQGDWIEEFVVTPGVIE